MATGLAPRSIVSGTQANKLAGSSWRCPSIVFQIAIWMTDGLVAGDQAVDIDQVAGGGVRYWSKRRGQHAVEAPGAAVNDAGRVCPGAALVGAGELAQRTVGQLWLAAEVFGDERHQ